MSSTTETRAAISRPGAGRPAARIIVRLRGALDVAAAPALRERLIDVLHPGMRLLAVERHEPATTSPSSQVLAG